MLKTIKQSLLLCKSNEDGDAISQENSVKKKERDFTIMYSLFFLIEKAKELYSAGEVDAEYLQYFLNMREKLIAGGDPEEINMRMLEFMCSDLKGDYKNNPDKVLHLVVKFLSENKVNDDKTLMPRLITLLEDLIEKD